MAKILLDKFNLGVITNADWEDLPDNALTSLKNMRSVPGKLVKTFGIGTKITTACTPAANATFNLYTYIHEKITGNGLSARVYLVVSVHATTHVVTIYAWDETTDANQWVTLDTLDAFVFSGTYINTKRKNPILCDNEVMRIYPGGYGSRLTATTYNGIWIGYIDREYFDGLYTPTALFYDAKMDIDKPVITSAGIGLYVTQKDAGEGMGYSPHPDHPVTIKYYKLSYIYDGIQESLLSDIMGVNYSDDTFGVLNFQFLTSSFNKRITGVNVYRSDNEYTDYRLIQTIDLLRAEDSSLTGTYAVGSPSSDDSTPNGRIYVPELSIYPFSSSYKYKIRIYGYGSSYYETAVIANYADDTNTSQTLDGTGRTLFICPTLESTDTIATNLWNQRWILMRSTDGGSSYSSVSEGKSGAFMGQYIGFIPDYTGTGISNMIGGVLYSEYADDYNVHKIIDNYKKAFLFNKRFITDTSSSGVSTTSWRLIKPVSGNYITRLKKNFIYFNMTAGTGKTYFFSRDPHGLVVGDVVTHSSFTEPTYNGSKTVSAVDGDYVYTVDVSYVDSTDTGIMAGAKIEYLFFDTGQAGTEPHYAEHEPSILVHADHVTVINERSWHAGNVILDPSGADEQQRNDVIAYSERGMIDVVPVKNIIRLMDREGGTCTGIAELFGNPVFLKKQGLIYLDTRSNPDTPAAWKVIESVHNIGNVAPYGHITVGDMLYVWYRDGGYKLRANNLAVSDSTPTEKLKFTTAIEDKYLLLSDANKEAIKTSYDPIRGEIVCYLGTELWAYNVTEETWRQIVSAITPDIFAKDENDQIIVYESSDKKIYSFGANESVGIQLKTKPFRLSFERGIPVQKITINYKSGTDQLTLYTYFEDDIPSGNIQPGVTYYNNGYTSVTYNGTAYTTTQTFVGIAGITTYTTSGSGSVLTFDTDTLPVHNTMREAWVAPMARTKVVFLEITSAASTNAIEIGYIKIETED